MRLHVHVCLSAHVGLVLVLLIHAEAVGCRPSAVVTWSMWPRSRRVAFLWRKNVIASLQIV